MIKQEILNLINENKATIGVIGLGYVGLPLVVEFARNNFRGIGFEVDQRKADEINNKRSYIPDVPNDHVAEAVEKDLLQATTDFSHLKECDVIIICVPTPLRKTKDPDMSYILTAAERIQENLRRGQLIILESTTYPGTTDEVLLPMFEEKGFKLDEDFLLAFSPERVDPGNPQFLTNNITKVVGGVTEDSTEAAAVLYGKIVETVHPVTSARVAEACKLWENTFRAVNIGMANEMAKLCNTLNIDTWEVVRAAATKPFGFMAFYPGPGIGGHCLTAKESVIVRDENGERVENLSELFEQEAANHRVRKFAVHGSEVIYKPNLETLSVDMQTNKRAWQPVEYLFRRQTDVDTVTITTSDNRTVTVTDLHPMLTVDGDGNLQQVFAKDLQAGDRLPINVAETLETTDFANPRLDLIARLPLDYRRKIRVRLKNDEWKNYRQTLKENLGAENTWEFIRQNYLPLETFVALESKLNVKRENLCLHIGRGTSASSFPAVIELTPDAARLIGYYLAEGCATIEEGNWRVRLTFNRDETEFVNDVAQILQDQFGVGCSINNNSPDYVTQIRVASALFGFLVAQVLQCGKGSTEMRIPDVLFGASTAHRQELLKGLLRGDGDVYVKTGTQKYTKNGKNYVGNNATAEVGYFSSSPKLMQQVVFLLQNAGFTPTFKRNKPHLQMKGQAQLRRLQSWLGEKGAKLQRYFDESRKIVSSRTFKKIGDLITVPVKSITINRSPNPIDVFSVEVAGNHTFATSYGIFVHNCIPLDPHYLSWKARQHGFDSRFISLAEEVNSSMPQHVLNITRDALNEKGKALKNAEVLILGVAYKKDIDDMRESPALSIIDLLRAKGAKVDYHDPFVAEVHFDHSHTLGANEPLFNVELTDERIKNADCIVIVTDHSTVDYNHVCDLANLVVDTRNALKPETRANSKAQIVRL